MACQQGAEGDSLPENRLGQGDILGTYHGWIRGDPPRDVARYRPVTQPCRLLRIRVFPTRTRSASTLDRTIFPGVWVGGSATPKTRRGWPRGRAAAAPPPRSARRELLS